jgi:6,7-dimethyl-8-ribityllumazine synthase
LKRDANGALSDPPSLSGKKIGIVAAEFYPELCEQLLDGARRAVTACGVEDSDVTVERVAGCFELPVAIMRMLRRGNFDAMVALGVVVRGDTPHFEYVAGECSRGLMTIQLTTGAPVGFGVLTVDTMAQAEERADPARLDKGFEAAAAALRVLSISSEPEAKPLGFRR